jgi:hypothetical protein
VILAEDGARWYGDGCGTGGVGGAAFSGEVRPARPSPARQGRRGLLQRDEAGSLLRRDEGSGGELLLKRVWQGLLRRGDDVAFSGEVSVAVASATGPSPARRRVDLLWQGEGVTWPG